MHSDYASREVPWFILNLLTALETVSVNCKSIQANARLIGRSPRTQRTQRREGSKAKFPEMYWNESGYFAFRVRPRRLPECLIGSERKVGLSSQTYCEPTSCLEKMEPRFSTARRRVAHGVNCTCGKPSLDCGTDVLCSFCSLGYPMLQTGHNCIRV